MSAPLAHMATHGVWMLLGTVALVLLVLGLLRALFPDFAPDDADNSALDPKSDRPVRGEATDLPAGDA